MARTRIGFVGLALLLGWLTAMPTQVSAEYFIDVYGGVASTASADVSVSVRESTGRALCFLFCSPETKTHKATQKVDFDSSFTIGGRLGYWAESYPWLGGAIDGSSFQADGDNVEISVSTVSLLLMVRWPFLLTSPEIPKGRLQPYVGVGPGFFFADMSADFRPTVSKKVDASARGVGLDVRAGLAWKFHPHVAIFGEYRFTGVSLNQNTDCKTLFCPKPNNRIEETTLTTNHVLAGLSFRF